MYNLIGVNANIHTTHEMQKAHIFVVAQLQDRKTWYLFSLAITMQPIKHNHTISNSSRSEKRNSGNRNKTNIFTIWPSPYRPKEKGNLC